MLHINNPQYAKERSESKPLSLEEQEDAVKKIRYMVTLARMSDIIELKDIKPIQHLLYHYESLQALSDFIGGWDGAQRLMNIVDPIPFEKGGLAFSEPNNNPIPSEEVMRNALTNNIPEILNKISEEKNK